MWCSGCRRHHRDEDRVRNGRTNALTQIPCYTRKGSALNSRRAAQCVRACARVCVCQMAGLAAPAGVDLSALMKMVAEAEAEGGVAQRDVEAARAATEADDQGRFEQELVRENAMLADAAMGKSAGTPCAKCGCGGAKKLCGRCRQVSYCSQQCQKQHWKRHKKQCTPTGDRPKESGQLSGTDIAAAMTAFAQTGDPSPPQKPSGGGLADATPGAAKDAGPVPNAFRECAELFVRQFRTSGGAWLPFSLHVCFDCVRCADRSAKILGLNSTHLRPKTANLWVWGSVRCRSGKATSVRVRKRHSMQQWLEQCSMMMTTVQIAIDDVKKDPGHLWWKPMHSHHSPRSSTFAVTRSG